MSAPLSELLPKAQHLLTQLITPDGFLASTQESDNYRRIWTRDSVVCGLAGLLLKDKTLVKGLRASLKTLGDHQHPSGMIPSNVAPEMSEVSYGSLVGRIDTASWWIFGACLYYQHTNDTIFWKYAQPIAEKAQSFLKAAEFNGKGWIYTPLSGNWADEYPVHGYTLYDNVLRLWAESLWLKLSNSDAPQNEILQKTLHNFWPMPESENDLAYQKTPFEELQTGSLSHFVSFILPGVYDTRFDAAGNALALLLFDLSEAQQSRLEAYIETLNMELGSALIPAFWPIITETSADYFLLKGNYSYDFKNHPGHFHNGGIWPVWMGLFCLGLSKQGMNPSVSEIVTAFVSTLAKHPHWNFHEYLDAHTLTPGGTEALGYTASGIVFMDAALQNKTSFS